MFTKCLPAGDLLDYLEDPRDHMGVRREMEPRRLRGDPELATSLIDAQAPPFVFGADKQKRKIRHYRRHLVHLISCFSEPRERVEKALPDVIRLTEMLILAGLRRNALSFVWVEHPENYGAHAHAGLVTSLLPEGGPYRPRLSAKLRLHFDRLVSRKLGLSDPLRPDRALLVMACWASWKPRKRPHILEIINATQERWKDERKEPMDHKIFLELLKGEPLRHTILATPEKDGEPQLVDPKAAPAGFEPYPHTVAIRVRDSEDVIYLRGPVCRPTFSADTWRDKLRRREEDAIQLQDHPEKVYQRFERLLEARVRLQRKLYGVGGDRDVVGIPYFKELRFQGQKDQSVVDRAQPGLSVDPDAVEIQGLELLKTGADIYYPFCCEVDLTTRDITAPEALKAEGWLDWDIMASLARARFQGQEMQRLEKLRRKRMLEVTLGEARRRQELVQEANLPQDMREGPRSTVGGPDKPSPADTAAAIRHGAGQDPSPPPPGQNPTTENSTDIS
jgi:hypothetical protein